MKEGREALRQAIIKARIAADQSQEEFAAVFQLAQQSTAKWESEGWVPRRHWKLLQEQYGINPEDFLDQDDELRRVTNFRVRGSHNAMATLGGKAATASVGGSSLAPLEQALIDELRIKDKDGLLLRSMLADLLQKKNEDDTGK